MANQNAEIDNNNKPTLTAVTDDSNQYIQRVLVDPTSGRVLVSATGVGTGTVSTVTDGTNTVNNATEIEFVGATVSNPSGSIAEVTISGGSGTVTSVSVATANGFSGTVANPTTTPAITIVAGAITPTSVNGLTITTTTGTLTIASGKTLTASNTLTFTGTDSSSVAFGAGGTVAYTNVATLSSLTSIGTIGTGVWQGTLIGATYGGTGVNNGSSTITIGGNVTFSGAYTFTGTLTANTSVTFPTSGTLVNTGVTTLSSLTTAGALVTTGTITSGGLGTGATLGGVTMSLGSDAVGDIYAATTSNVLSRIAAVATGSVLVSKGTTTLPAWSSGPTVSNMFLTANAITASSNAATVPVTSGRNIVTNNSASGLTITMTTTNAVSMQTCIVQILPSSAVAQTLTFVNTENSAATSVPANTGSSTTIPISVGFIYNAGTSKWTCVASS